MVYEQPCEICGNPSQHKHHINGKRNITERNIAYVCIKCHFLIHKLARKKFYLSNQLVYFVNKLKKGKRRKREIKEIREDLEEYFQDYDKEFYQEFMEKHYGIKPILINKKTNPKDALKSYEEMF